MQAQIENLVKLQSVDLERARLTLALRALPAEIAEAAAALTAAERQSAEASDALAARSLCVLGWIARLRRIGKRLRGSAPSSTR